MGNGVLDFLPVPANMGTRDALPAQIDHPPGVRTMLACMSAGTTVSSLR